MYVNHNHNQSSTLVTPATVKSSSITTITPALLFLLSPLPSLVFPPLNLPLYLRSILRLHVPRRVVLANDHPAIRVSSFPFSFPLPSIILVAVKSRAPYTPGGLPHQLGKMPRGLAEAGRALEIVFVSLVAPCFYCGSYVRVALGEVFAEGAGLGGGEKMVRI